MGLLNAVATPAHNLSLAAKKWDRGVDQFANKWNKGVSQLGKKAKEQRVKDAQRMANWRNKVKMRHVEDVQRVKKWLTPQVTPEPRPVSEPRPVPEPRPEHGDIRANKTMSL